MRSGADKLSNVEKSQQSGALLRVTLVHILRGRMAYVTMIIACPACKTRYVVPENAIGDSGRTVRCAKCKHSWFQEPEFDLPPRDEEPVEPPAVAPTPPSPPPITNETDRDTGGPSINRWRSSDEVESASTATAGSAAATTSGSDSEKVSADMGRKIASDMPTDVTAERDNADIGPAAGFAGDDSEIDDLDETPSPYVGDDYDEYDDGEESRFGYRPPFTGRRNPLKMWTAAAAIFALLAVGTIAAINFNLVRLPAWAPFSQSSFGLDQPNLVLDFPNENIGMETLPSGTEIFQARGTITNQGRETVNVPPLRIVLRDERERIVFDWIVAPPQSTLAPGESMNVTEAKTDVPRSARLAEIGWAPN